MITKKIVFISAIGIVFCMISCRKKQSESQEATKSDSVELNTFSSDSLQLTTLIKNLLEWREMDRFSDFDVITNFPEDSIYTGIDWEAHNKRMKQLSETEFFTKEFLINYQNIATYLDKELKQNPEKYYVGELPPYGNDTNEWCNCQDYPDHWEKLLLIVDLKMSADSANFKWTWNKEEYYYSVKAQKKDGSWRISYLERFDGKEFMW